MGGLLANGRRHYCKDSEDRMGWRCGALAARVGRRDLAPDPVAGATGDLPSAAQVEAVADSMLNADIPLGKRVVFPTFKYGEARLVALGLGQLTNPRPVASG